MCKLYIFNTLNYSFDVHREWMAMQQVALSRFYRFGKFSRTEIFRQGRQ